MAKILENYSLTRDFWCMKVECGDKAQPGQFYMLRTPEGYPLLSRPLSIFDLDGKSVSFIYKVVGTGTKLFTTRHPGDEIIIDGPHGHGFPILKGRIALLGGGSGIPPLYYAAKRMKEADPTTVIDVFLGLRDEGELEKLFKGIVNELHVGTGSEMLAALDPMLYDGLMTCGSERRMKTIYEKCKEVKPGLPVYVSVERRMACGIGVCLVCSCKTRHGNKRVCKDGPVFLGSEVFYE